MINPALKAAYKKLIINLIGPDLSFAVSTKNDPFTENKITKATKAITFTKTIAASSVPSAANFNNLSNSSEPVKYFPNKFPIASAAKAAT